MSLRAHLVAPVVAALLPVLLFSGFVVVLLAREQRVNVERGLRQTARALAQAVDEQIGSRRACGGGGRAAAGSPSAARS